MLGFETSDDCAVYRINDDMAAVLTVDFFTPVVDDPYEFGAIAAANALSDVFAMGAKPLTALNILAFPCSLGTEVVGEVMRGGADKVAEALACAKADGYDRSLLKQDEVLLTADTIVVVDGKVTGKPHGRDEAIAMLHTLSGKTHIVYTGVCLRSLDRNVSFTERTDVHFKELTDDEITYYVDTYKPFDKAGAYGIQEWIGMIGIDRIEGDFYNVMGFPVAHIWKVLRSKF